MHQLAITISTLTLMFAAALAGVNWGIFAFAIIGGWALSQYDSARSIPSPDSNRG